MTAIDEGNLMFVTYNKSTNQYAIAVRGTYPYFGLALLVDLYEDLDVSHPLPWQYPPAPGALVAGGTIDGLNDLIRFTSHGLAFHNFVDSQIAPSGADIFVTGHSLGGALTTVLAPWLVYRLSQSNAKNMVMPYSYAGPTAGNAAFASFYTGLFKSSYRYYNTIDIVPKAWADLLSIKSLYSSPGPACPWELKGIIDLISDWLNGIKVSYTQPNGSGTKSSRNTVTYKRFFCRGPRSARPQLLFKIVGRSHSSDPQLRARQPIQRKGSTMSDAETVPRLWTLHGLLTQIL